MQIVALFGSLSYRMSQLLTRHLVYQWLDSLHNLSRQLLMITFSPQIARAKCHTHTHTSVRLKSALNLDS